MTLYVIENDNGEVLDGIYCEFTNDVDRTMVFDEPIEPAEYANLYGGHVVELVEKPELVEVSEEEVKMLEQAKCDDDPAELIVGFVNSRDNYDDDRKDEDRLMRAYVNGYTVEKPKRYVLPMEGTVDEDAEYQMYAIVDSGIWGTVSLSDSVAAPTVTQADIDAAPDWVKAITPVEVADDEQ